MATSYNERRYGGEFLVSEGKGDISREAITAAAGQNLKAGQPYAKLTSGGNSGKAVAINPAGADGSQTAVGLVYDDIDATAGDKKGAGVCRLAEYNESLVVWNGLTAPQITAVKATFAAQNLIARKGI